MRSASCKTLNRPRKSSRRLTGAVAELGRHYWIEDLASPEKFRGEEEIKMKQLFPSRFSFGNAVIAAFAIMPGARNARAGGRDSNIDHWLVRASFRECEGSR